MYIFLRILLNNCQSLRVVENDKVQTFTKGFTTHFCEGGGSPSQIHWIFLSPSNPPVGGQATKLCWNFQFFLPCFCSHNRTSHKNSKWPICQVDPIWSFLLFEFLEFLKFDLGLGEKNIWIFEFMWFGNFIMRWKGWEIDLLLWGLISLCRRRCAYNIGSNQTFTRHSASKCSKSYDHWPFQCLILLCNAMT